jgi:hypothetical protein
VRVFRFKTEKQIVHENTRVSQGFLQATRGRRRHDVSIDDDIRGAFKMTKRAGDEIRRLQDGSIDYAYYSKIGLEARSECLRQNLFKFPRLRLWSRSDKARPSRIPGFSGFSWDVTRNCS